MIRIILVGLLVLHSTLCQTTCNSEIEKLLQCKQTAKENSGISQAVLEQIDHCFTSNNCESPEQIRSDQEPVRECFWNLRKKIRNTCQSEVNPGFEFPVPGWTPNSGHCHGHWRQFSNRYQLLKRIMELCPSNDTAPAVESCMSNVRLDMKSDRSNWHEKIRACHDALPNNCRRTMKDTHRRMCACAQTQLNLQESKDAIQSCHDLDTTGWFQRHHPHGPRLFMFCHYGARCQGTEGCSESCRGRHCSGGRHGHRGRGGRGRGHHGRRGGRRDW